MAEKCSSCGNLIEETSLGFGKEKCDRCGVILCPACIKTDEVGEKINVFCYKCHAEEAVKRRKGLQAD